MVFFNYAQNRQKVIEWLHFHYSIALFKDLS